MSSTKDAIKSDKSVKIGINGSKKFIEDHE